MCIRDRSNTPLTPAPGDFSAAEAVGRAFLDAWSKDDPARMYELLAPSLRAGLALDPFAQAYRAAQTTATVLQVRTLPHQLGLENTRAWIDFTVLWHTALFGELQAENRLALINEGDAWWVDWRREAIWPDLAGGNKFAVEYQATPRANISDHLQAELHAPSAPRRDGRRRTTATAACDASGTPLPQTGASETSPPPISFQTFIVAPRTPSFSCLDGTSCFHASMAATTSRICWRKSASL
mgnify:CR=1 FL=1